MREDVISFSPVVRIHNPQTSLRHSLTSKRPPFMPLQIQAWRRGGGGGILQRSPKINLYLQAEANTETGNIDKTTERDLQIVVEKGSRLLSQTRAEVVDFTSHADLTTHPGRYVIYREVKGEAADGVLDACCREMDASFADHGYVVSRKTGSIGPLELRIVETGTFGKILEYYIGNGVAMSQFKTLRCTTNQVLLRILDRCTVKRFRTTAYG